METREAMTFNTCLDDTIQHFETKGASMDDSVVVLKPVSAKVTTTMDCDNHPSCDCYSQCHIVIW